MLVLLTNDDGVHAEGLRVLHDEFARGHEVYVVAPDRERSGSSHAITVFQPLMVHRTRVSGGGGEGETGAAGPEASRRREAWAVVGTPADCVKLAVASLLPRRPDLVVSGINRGPNLGTDVFYSGTVSAAIEAAILGLPALAVSLAGFKDLDYGFAARFARYLAQRVVSRGLPPATLLNVNVPAVDARRIKGVRITGLSGHKWYDRFEERADPRGRTYFWLVGEPLEAEVEQGSDLDAVNRGYVSVTPIHLDLTNRPMMAELEKWSLDLGEVEGR